MSRVSSLHRLQNLDLELDRINHRLDEIAAILQDSSLIEELQGKLDSEEDLLAQEQSKVKSAEHEVQMLQEKIKNTETSLYGGAVTIPKELQDLQMEHEALQRHMTTLEDRLLEAMVQAEQAQESHAIAEQDLQMALEARSADHQDLMLERDELTNQAERLTGEREPMLEGITADDLELYQSLRTRFNGMAVAVLDADSCGACGLTLPASEQQTVRSGSDPVLCIQCGRILYGG
jgi:hypothetical protein